MSKDIHERCKRAITEIRKTIPGRIAKLDEQFVEVIESEDKCDPTRLYAEAMTDLVFDVIGHAISYTDSTEGLEAFKERLQDAVQTLDIAIDVWNQSHDPEAEWHDEFEEVMNRQQ